ncbi:MAG: hypothetical protein QXN05_04630 [Acidilobaceae archaeon]
MEEPKEPLREDCRVRVIGGGLALDLALDEMRKAIYEYNSKIRESGYYLKPVHKTYKTLREGVRRVYEYYGIYWWRLIKTKRGLRYFYVGKHKPPGLPEPPRLPVEGLSLARDGRDVIIECRVYDKFKDFFRGFQTVREV